MKKLLAFLILIIALTSCSNYSGNRKPKSETDKLKDTGRDVPFRAHGTWFSTVTYDRLVNNTIQIVYADSAFRSGDTVLIGDTEYILQERVK